MTSKQQPPTARKLPPNAGKGRRKGSPNKTTTALKDAILLAAAEVGEDGAGKGDLTGYLRLLARAEPKAFATLLGRVLPLQLSTDPDNPFTTVHRIELVGVAPK